MRTDLLALELTETHRDWLIHKPIEIAMYLLIAFLLRLLAHKVIDRMTQPPQQGPALLRPLQERAARIRGGTATEKAAAALASARRAQRAQTIGSVLKSTVSIVVLAWCVLQVLGILGVN